jgi:hypothetical protein
MVSSSARLRLTRWTVAHGVLVRTAHHAEVVPFAAFLFFWEVFPIRTEAFERSGSLSWEVEVDGVATLKGSFDLDVDGLEVEVDEEDIPDDLEDGTGAASP